MTFARSLIITIAFSIWGIAAPLDEAVPAPVLSAALYERFSSRGEADFGDKVLSALRYQFGGHKEKVAATKADA